MNNSVVPPARILVVEDEAIVAMDIRAQLVKLGYEVCACVASGKEAIQQVSELKPDLVLMDIRLQGEIDGITAVAEIKKTHNTPVIYLTAHADEATLARAKITEPYGYVLKPFEAVELRVAIELALYKAAQHSRPATVPAPTQFEDLPEQVLDNFRRVSELEVFSGLDPDALLGLVEPALLKTFKAGEHLALEGEERSSGFLVLKGRIALFKSSLSGRELIVELLVPGDVLGLILSIEDQPYSFSSRAQMESEVLIVPRASLLRFLDRHPKWYRNFVGHLAERLSKAHAACRALAHDKVEARIAASLLQLISDGSPGSIPKNGTVHITRKELAELAGTTVETSIRVTKAMERDGVLALPENGVISVLDPQALTDTMLS